MKKMFFTSAVCFLYTLLYAQQPKIISDCTLSFTITDSGALKQTAIGSKVIYIKGKDIRIDVQSDLFSQTIFYNSNTGNATVLKTVGQSKYISNYTADEWKKENEMYNDISISFTGNTKKILDYSCKEAVLKLKNGGSFTVFYTPALMPSVTENAFEFKDVPGLILEYGSLTGENEKIIYTADKIEFNPVPALQFKIPAKGYRILH